MGTMVGVRGEAYEELAEIHQALAQKYAGLAYQDLSRDPRFVRQESERLEKMRQLQGE